MNAPRDGFTATLRFWYLKLTEMFEHRKFLLGKYNGGVHALLEFVGIVCPIPNHFQPMGKIYLFTAFDLLNLVHESV